MKDHFYKLMFYQKLSHCFLMFFRSFEYVVGTYWVPVHNMQKVCIDLPQFYYTYVHTYIIIYATCKLGMMFVFEINCFYCTLKN